MTGTLDDTGLSRLRRAGIAAMPTPEALALFDAACAAGAPVSVPAPRGRRRPADRAVDDVPLLLRDLATTGRTRRTGPGRPRTKARLTARLAALPADEAAAAVLDWVRDQVAVVLGHPSGAAVDAGQTFTQLGFDSLTSVELCNRLAAATGLRLPSTLVFQPPDPHEMGEHLHGLLRSPHPTGPGRHRRNAEDAGIREALRHVSIEGLRRAGLWTWSGLRRHVPDGRRRTGLGHRRRAGRDRGRTVGPRPGRTGRPGPGREGGSDHDQLRGSHGGRRGPGPAGAATHSSRARPPPPGERRPEGRPRQPDRRDRHGLPLPRRRGHPEDLWDMLREARDAVDTFPTDRGWRDV
ncbi:beta-ketoacyl reductase [Streptomyces sp. KL116D]|uniref:acyl carrier protein n=1 Tax=Streptomyces sp. KL116D TaxID=3045152 RepID=UPI0035592DF8